jgi:hypothetical protein
MGVRSQCAARGDCGEWRVASEVVTGREAEACLVRHRDGEAVLLLRHYACCPTLWHPFDFDFTLFHCLELYKNSPHP